MANDVRYVFDYCMRPSNHLADLVSPSSLVPICKLLILTADFNINAIVDFVDDPLEARD